MPKFTNEPPPETKGYALPIVRTPAHGKFEAIVTSDDLIGTNTHWWGGRTVPCEAPECEACHNGSPFRWHAYCSCYNPNTGLHVLYEVTAQAAETLVQYRRSHNTLRGALIRAYRWRSAPNGRVVLRATPSATPHDVLPKPPNLLKILAILWKFPENGVHTDGRGPGGADFVPRPVPDNCKPPPDPTGV